jgi:hypothetical protein
METCIVQQISRYTPRPWAMHRLSYKAGVIFFPPEESNEQKTRATFNSRAFRKLSSDSGFRQPVSHECFHGSNMDSKPKGIALEKRTGRKRDGSNGSPTKISDKNAGSGPHKFLCAATQVEVCRLSSDQRPRRRYQASPKAFLKPKREKSLTVFLQSPSTSREKKKVGTLRGFDE